MKLLLLFLSTLCTVSSHATDKSRCLSYEPTQQTVEGTLFRKTFAGPPNYESTRKGDRPETYFLLKLRAPVCVTRSTTDPDVNHEQEGIRVIQLVFADSKNFKKYAALVNGKVIAHGTLFAAITGHRHEPLLLTVTSLTKEE